MLLEGDVVRLQKQVQRRKFVVVDRVGSLIGGSIIIESIFALPGVGRLLVNSIYSRDFIVIQGCVTFIAVAYVLVNFTVDMIYALLDPRIRVA